MGCSLTWSSLILSSQGRDISTINYLFGNFTLLFEIWYLTSEFYSISSSCMPWMTCSPYPLGMIFLISSGLTSQTFYFPDEFSDYNFNSTSSINSLDSSTYSFDNFDITTSSLLIIVYCLNLMISSLILLCSFGSQSWFRTCRSGLLFLLVRLLYFSLIASALYKSNLNNYPTLAWNFFKM